MKLIMREVSESSIELEEPEITIVDKKHPERSYILIPKGGYLIMDADFIHKIYRIDMSTTVELMTISMDTDIPKYP